MVTVVTYPIVRIIFLLLIRGSAAAARDIDVPHPGAGSELKPPPPGLLPACGRRSYLAAVPRQRRPMRMPAWALPRAREPSYHADK